MRRRPQLAPVDLCTAFCSLYIAARGLSTTAVHRAAGGSNNATPNPQHSAVPDPPKKGTDATSDKNGKLAPSTPALQIDRREAARQRAKYALAEQKVKAQAPPQQGGLASDSIFADEHLPTQGEGAAAEGIKYSDVALSTRSPQQMAARLNPNPDARARWQRKMVIRSIRRGGRLTREMQIARTERSHTSKSRFFKTSVKKLAPLARQIAGKSLDEAILQMRFSHKRAAVEVQKHLIQARNEAIVMRGMGIPDPNQPRPTSAGSEGSKLSVEDRIRAAVKNSQAPISPPPPITEQTVHAGLTQSTPVIERQTPELTSPAETVPLPSQTPSKSLKANTEPNSTDMYIAQAWVNRGPYGAAPDYRARGRVFTMRLPHTGISVMLKEEKTRTREKAEKEMKAIRKRLSGKVWTQLPDRPIVRQSQHVLW